MDIWHADGLGAYSDESSQGTVGQTWLRGVQLTDADGLVRFTTIYPGFYQGRAPHIHVKVHTGGSHSRTRYSRGHVVRSGEFFFPEATSTRVYRTSTYTRDPNTRTRNAAGRVYTGQHGASSILRIAGSPAIGLRGGSRSRSRVHAMTGVYESDPRAAPDSEFRAGELADLVVGNRGRLLDARRTPVAVTGVNLETGMFAVEVLGFEDAGARWELPVEDVGGFQFARDGRRAADDVVASLAEAVRRFDRPGDVACEPRVRESTLRRVGEERRRAREWLAARRDRLGGIDVAGAIARREGDPRLFALVDEFLGESAEMDRRFAAVFVSHPGSGEVVKGHAIVLAELGLCPYSGKVVRDPRALAGEWARERRAAHLLARLAFTRELWSLLGAAALPVYRGAATDGPLPRRRPASFVSATFSREVAEAHFAGGPTTRVAVMWRQAVPLERLLMTFLETEALNHPFKEAEAVLLGDPDNRAF